MKRDAHFALQRFQLHLHLAAQIGVQRRKRLIEQQHTRAIHQRASQRHTLLLAAAQLCRSGLREFAHFHHRQRLRDALGNFRLRSILGAQAVRHVFEHRKMRKNRVALENSVHLATMRGNAIQPLRAHPDFAAVQIFEPGDQPQQSRFARAALAENGEKFTAGDIQVIPRSTGRRPNRFMTWRMERIGALAAAAVAAVPTAAASGEVFVTAPPLFRSRFRCTCRGAARSARNKCASCIRPHCPGAAISAARRS